VYGIPLLAGLLLPFGFLYLRFALDTKIHSRQDLEKALPQVPVVAEIPFIPQGSGKKDKEERSQLGESFRILSTNVNFLLRGKADGTGKVVFVTSSVKGEGKTLVAVELAQAYADLHKKVLIIGADLRNPRLHEYFPGSKNDTGLSDYLADPGLDWKACLKQPDPEHPWLKTVFSGRIPPNAPQLLAGPRFAEFLSHARVHFDLVLVDTAPTVLVTDTLMIADQADVTLYVARAEYSEKQLMEHAENLFKSGKLENMALVVNDVKRGQAKGYNYGYGYGYSERKAKKPWYKRAFGG
jgi:capsular exopolysaccharide synthesis family protein